MPTERVTPSHGPHGPELEELPVERLARSPQTRLGLGAIVAIVALVGLLAGGLGVLGGRPATSPASTSPASTSTVVGPSGTTAPPTPRPPTPAITPYMECGPDPGDTPPVVSLQTNGVPTKGLVQLLEEDATPTAVVPTPENPLELLRGPRVEIQPDVVTELWIDQAACALRWFVGIYDPVTAEGFQIAEAPIDGPLDPRVAAQNRFNLSHLLAPHRAYGNDLQLIAALEFREIVVTTLWRIRIHDVPIPVAMLRHVESGRLIPVVADCEVSLRLANGYTEPLYGCEEDLTSTLGSAARVRRTDPLLLEFDGIAPDNMLVVCGRLSGLSFIAEPEPGCSEEPDHQEPFRADAEPGTWVLAMSTCASAGGGTLGAFNYVCGTWYANVQVGERAVVDS